MYRQLFEIVSVTSDQPPLFDVRNIYMNYGHRLVHSDIYIDIEILPLALVEYLFSVQAATFSEEPLHCQQGVGCPHPLSKLLL